jgi:hypothetical protein
MRIKLHSDLTHAIAQLDWAQVVHFVAAMNVGEVWVCHAGH